MPRAPNTVPLVCSLCPKTPTFSDISHLLTHISSKSHLANRFKLQIRAQQEPEARQTLDNFEAWYESNDLDTLLAERLATKESKQESKMKKKAKAKAKATKDTEVKKEPVKREKSSRVQETLAATPAFRAPMPRLHLWPVGGSNTASPTPLRRSERTPKTYYETPTLRRRVPNFSMQQTPSAKDVNQKAETPWKPDPEEDENDNMKPPDSAKLKGVFWPGMDLFDSATPEQKRMRNQRKDGAVLEQMLATSASVEPFEVSYQADGSFRGSRDIFGPLSTENSPVAPPPKKRNARPRKAVLKDVSTNIPHLQVLNQQQNSGFSPEKQLATQTHNGLQQPSQMHMPNPFAAMGGKFASSIEETEEFRLNLGVMSKDKGKKRAFGVFQDAPEASPGRTESPLEEYMPAGQLFDFQNDGLPAYPAFNSATLSPTPTTKPGAMHLSAKKKASSGKKSRGSGPSGHIAPSQLFQEHVINPLYAQTYSQTQSFSYGGHDFNQDVKPMTGLFGDFKPVGPPLGPVFDDLAMSSFQGCRFDSGNDGSDSNEGMQQGWMN